MTDAVLYTVVDGVATVTLDRPQTRNALSPDTLAALHDALLRSAEDHAVRVVVLTGNGATFCSGADLSAADLSAADLGAADLSDGDLSAADLSDGEAGRSRFAAGGAQRLVSVLQVLLDHPKPTIARVQGHVAGGGNGLVAACDFAVAVTQARFAFSEVRLGVAPAVVAVACLRVMRPRDAAELMLTGETVGAERALAAGLVSAVVELVALDTTVAAWVSQLSRGGPGAVAATKTLLRRVPGMDRDEAFAWTAQLSQELFGGAEANDGIAAFLARRSPPWASRA